jgi:hypothetical protein
MRWLRKSWPYFLLALLIVVNAGVLWQRERLADWWRLRNYAAPVDIVSLAMDDTMTPVAKNLFFVNHPQLENKENFNTHCADRSEKTAVLGCYRGNRQGIYIYAVTDARLSGVRQVTAAHETLHQAYDRLSTKDRQHIDGLLEDFYQHTLTDQTIKDKIESYKSQPNVVLVNEMHSIFGTEVRQLTPELEQYYKKYFDNRSKIVDYRDAYQAEFTRRQTLVEDYDKQLTGLKKQIDNNKATLEDEMTFLNAKEKAINQDANRGDQAAYQSDITAYNDMVETYNALLVTTRNQISQYNQIANQRNDIAVEEQQLQQALDSRLTTPNTKQ